MSYETDRARFICAIEDSSVPFNRCRHIQYIHRESSSLWAPLCTDVVYIGELSSDRRPVDSSVIVVISGTAGNEAPLGSMVQSILIEEEFYGTLPKGVGLLFVHSLNPWGHYYGRPTDHNNIYVDRAGGTGIANGERYSQYASVVYPDNWGPEKEEALWNLLQNDPCAFPAIISGQRSFPKGLFYQGESVCWSISILRDICRTFFSFAQQRVAVIEVQGGAVATIYGKGITYAPGGMSDWAQEEIQKWYGLGVLFAKSENTVLNAMVRFLDGKLVVPVAVGVGTDFPPFQPLIYMAAENWAYHNPHRVYIPTYRQLARRMDRVFSPQQDELACSLWGHFLNTFEAALKGLCS